jgi:hypothetical protein
MVKPHIKQIKQAPYAIEGFLTFIKKDCLSVIINDSYHTKLLKEKLIGSSSTIE